jgi:hypothetical protein
VSIGTGHHHSPHASRMARLAGTPARGPISGLLLSSESECLAGVDIVALDEKRSSRRPATACLLRPKAQVNRRGGAGQREPQRASNLTDDLRGSPASLSADGLPQRGQEPIKDLGVCNASRSPRPPGKCLGRSSMRPKLCRRLRFGALAGTTAVRRYRTTGATANGRDGKRSASRKPMRYLGRWPMS